MTASGRVSVIPVARRAPAAKATKLKEIFFIKLFLTRKILTIRRESIDEMNVKKSINPSI